MKKLLISLAFLMVLNSCSSLKNMNNNQKIRNHALVNDSHWNELTKVLIQNIDRGLDTNLDTNLSLYHPKLLAQINQDSKDPYLLMFWGKSYNVDASNSKTIVNEDLLKGLHQKFNVYTTGTQAHAGIIHTYGYLFSLLDTPYGFKRKRWIDQSLNQAFSFENLSLSPDSLEGGLLSNLTYFIGMITLKNKTNLQLLKNVSQEVERFDYDGLKTFHLIETTKNIIIKTSFVSFPKKISNEDNSFLLIYTIYDLQLDKEFLITAFPVNQKTFLNAQDKTNLGKNKSISLKYNAAHDQFVQGTLGTRTFFNNHGL